MWAQLTYAVSLVGHKVCLHALALLSHGYSNIFLKTKATDQGGMSFESPSGSPYTGWVLKELSSFLRPIGSVSRITVFVIMAQF